MRVKIVSGTYGWHPRKDVLKPVTRRDAPIDLEYGEAVRLINLGVAVPADDGTSPIVDNPVATSSVESTDDGTGVNLLDGIVLPEREKMPRRAPHRKKGNHGL